LAWHTGLCLSANLARHSNLLVNGRATDDVANFLGLGRQAN
jgi:hypothetical protein